MSEVIKKATRESYGEALVALAEKYENLVENGYFSGKL